MKSYHSKLLIWKGWCKIGFGHTSDNWMLIRYYIFQAIFYSTPFPFFAFFKNRNRKDATGVHFRKVASWIIYMYTHFGEILFIKYYFITEINETINFKINKCEEVYVTSQHMFSQQEWIYTLLKKIYWTISKSHSLLNLPLGFTGYNVTVWHSASVS